MSVGPMTLGMINSMNKEDTILLYAQLALDNEPVGMLEVHNHLCELIEAPEGWNPGAQMYRLMQQGVNLQQMKENLEWQIYMLNPDECFLCGEIITREAEEYMGHKFCSKECVRELCMNNADAMDAFHPFG